MTAPTLRIAMWSGPRSLSTALMRSFASRPDTIVIDEPFYACYLARTGIDHPGRDVVLAQCETSPHRVVAQLLAPLPPGRRVFYQKHMAHHLLPGFDRSFLAHVRNAFLIRDPAAVLASYANVIDTPTLDDLGFPQLAALYDEVRQRFDPDPPVIDARDLLEHPRETLSALCHALDIPFDDNMLHWPPGPQPTDGPWAPYWYAAVLRSTGFGAYRPPGPVPDRFAALHRACRQLYEPMWSRRLIPAST